MQDTKSGDIVAVDMVVWAATEFYKQLQEDRNDRYRSWEYCYSCFIKARNQTQVDDDYLCLQLAFYLASWGMYRGSSFLLQKDYRVHLPLIRELLKTKYDPLSGIECSAYCQQKNMNLLMELNEYIRDYYDKVRLDVIYRNPNKEPPKKQISDTLLTKVLMGTLGCVPAYDRYFIAGVKYHNVSTGSYSEKSIRKLCDFYKENNSKLEDARKKLSIEGIPYPQMKMLDMGFWQIGYELEKPSVFKATY